MLRAQSKAALLTLLAAITVPQLGNSAPVTDLYAAQVPAAALSGPALDEAFALALGQVLVKVTGQRGIAADPVPRRAIGPAAPLVRQYQPLAGRQVRVSFDPSALRSRLDAAGLPVWSDDRPLTLIVLPGDLLAISDTAAEEPGTARQLLLETAAGRGIPVVLGPEPIPGVQGGGDPLLDPEATARAAGADVLLVGRPVTDGDPGLLRWTLVQGADQAEWQGDTRAGANGLADRLAARYAAAASAGRVLRVTVTEVNSFDDYGRLQNFLRSVGLIQSTELKAVSGDSLTFDVAVRGDIGQLNDAFALRRMLEPSVASGSGDLVYQLLPAGP